MTYYNYDRSIIYCGNTDKHLATFCKHAYLYVQIRQDIVKNYVESIVIASKGLYA